MAYRKPKPWGNVKPPVGSQVDFGSRLGAGLFGAWLFNEKGGTIVDNSLGKKSSFAGITPPVWARGKFGGSGVKLASDGTSSISFPSVTVKQKFSVSLWVNPSVASLTNYYRMVENSFLTSFYLGIENNGRFTFIVNNDFNVIDSSLASYSTNTWYHVVGVYDGTTAYIYRDGILRDSATVTAPSDVTQAIVFGSLTTLGFPGTYDHIRIYDRALSPNEVGELYTHPFAGIVTPKTNFTSSYESKFPLYTKEAKASLPTIADDLATIYTDAEYTAAATDDGSYVDEVGDGYVLHEFKNKNTNNTDQISVSWNGKSTLSCATSTTFLQIFDYNSSAWETLSSNTTTAAGTDFTLTGVKTISLSNYYGGATGFYWTNCRIYQAL